jgi:hypothetical protein
MLTTLAQRGFDIGDWVEYILIAVVVGLSVLGTVARKLIEAFSPKEKDQDQAATFGGGPMESIQPLPPHARPARRTVIRPREVDGAPGELDSSVPQRTTHGELPTVLREMIQELTGVPMETVRSRPRVEPPRPPQPANSVSPSPAPPVRRKPPAPPSPARQVRSTKPQAQAAVDDVFTTVDDGARRFGSDLSQRMSHLETSFSAQDAGSRRAGEIWEPPQAGARRTAWRPAPGELRRAIVMFEILSPPVSLRPPGDARI